MIKEALEWISEHSQPKLEKIGKLTYSSKNLHLITEPMASPLKVSTLSGFVDYICNDPDTMIDDDEINPFVLVEPARVSLVCPLTVDTRQREVLLVAEPHSIGKWTEEKYIQTEDFNIMVQSCCLPTEGRDALLSLTTNLAHRSEVVQSDDGFTQHVNVKNGIKLEGWGKMPNPLPLQPFSTFPEVEQPERLFVVRVQKAAGGDEVQLMVSPCDGGAWRLKAIESIHAYLKERIDLRIIS